MKLDRLGVHAFWNSFATNVAGPFVSFDVTAEELPRCYIGGYLTKGLCTQLKTPPRSR